MPLSLSPIEPSSPQTGRGFVRLRIDLAYDGTNFAGWALQRSLRTVQGEVQVALGTSLRVGAPVDVIVAGRTDAGVHARGQVIHCDVPEESLFDLDKMTYSLNGLLPEDIRVHSVVLAPEGFDARFSAIARRYSYAIADGLQDPLMRFFAVSYWKRLDEDAMNAASAQLLGLHDFTSFCKQKEFATTIRTLQEFSWHRTEYGVVATLQADAFCHSMVRSLVGALIPVGSGRRPVDFPRMVLERRSRNSDVETMAGHGLVLEQVLYPADDQLLARQEMTRARRTQEQLDY